MKRNLFITVVTVSALVVSAGAGLARDGQRPSFGELDSNSDGEITRSELTALSQARFASNDSNGDGKLDKAELTAAAARRSEHRIERMMDRLDADGDGALSFAELSERRGPAGMIDRFDTDGNGSLSEAEFDAGREKMRARWGQHRNKTTSD